MMKTALSTVLALTFFATALASGSELTTSPKIITHSNCAVAVCGTADWFDQEMGFILGTKGYTVKDCKRGELGEPGDLVAGLGEGSSSTRAPLGLFRLSYSYYIGLKRSDNREPPVAVLFTTSKTSVWSADYAWLSRQLAREIGQDLPSCEKR